MIVFAILLRSHHWRNIIVQSELASKQDCILQLEGHLLPDVILHFPLVDKYKLLKLLKLSLWYLVKLIL